MQTPTCNSGEQQHQLQVANYLLPPAPTWISSYPGCLPPNLGEGGGLGVIIVAVVNQEMLLLALNLLQLLLVDHALLLL